MNTDEWTTMNSSSIVRRAYFSTPWPKTRGSIHVTRNRRPRPTSGAAEIAHATRFMRGRSAGAASTPRRPGSLGLEQRRPPDQRVLPEETVRLLGALQRELARHDRPDPPLAEQLQRLGDLGQRDVARAVDLQRPL